MVLLPSFHGFEGSVAKLILSALMGIPVSAEKQSSPQNLLHKMGGSQSVQNSQQNGNEETTKIEKQGNLIFDKQSQKTPRISIHDNDEIEDKTQNRANSAGTKRRQLEQDRQHRVMQREWFFNRFPKNMYLSLFKTICDSNLRSVYPGGSQISALKSYMLLYLRENLWEEYFFLYHGRKASKAERNALLFFRDRQHPKINAIDWKAIQGLLRLIPQKDILNVLSESKILCAFNNLILELIKNPLTPTSSRTQSYEQLQETENALDSASLLLSSQSSSSRLGSDLSSSSVDSLSESLNCSTPVAQRLPVRKSSLLHRQLFFFSNSPPAGAAGVSTQQSEAGRSSTECSIETPRENSLPRCQSKCDKALPVEEILIHCVCIFYPNYEELWSPSFSLVLTSYAARRISDFLRKHPKLDEVIIFSVLSAGSDLADQDEEED